MNNFLTDADIERMEDIFKKASRFPSEAGLQSLTPEQAMCIGYIQGITSKVGDEVAEKE